MLIFPGQIQVRGRDKRDHDCHFVSCQIGACRAADVNTLGTTASGVECAGVDFMRHQGCLPFKELKQKETNLHSTSSSTLRTAPKDSTCLLHSPVPDHFAKTVESLSYKFQISTIADTIALTMRQTEKMHFWQDSNPLKCSHFSPN